MDSEKKTFLEGNEANTTVNENEYYMDLEPPPAYSDVYTISDKVPMKRVVGLRNRAQRRVTMLDTPRKRLMFLGILTAILLILTVLALLAVQRYAHMVHPRRYSGPCQVMLPHEGGPLDESASYPDSITEDLDITDSYERVSNRGFSHYSGAEVLHMFNKRLTVIKSNGLCLVKPMRPDLRPPKDIEEFIESLRNGAYLPHARLTREHWFMSMPMTSPVRVNAMFGPVVAKHCAGVPTVELVPRSVMEQRIAKLLALNEASVECAQYKCRPCGRGWGFKVDQHGCQMGCTCHPFLLDNVISGGRICTPLTDDNCPLFCTAGFARSVHGCPICRCVQLATKRKRRNIEALQQTSVFDFVDKCNVTMQVFEGLAPGDERQLATVDHVHQCRLE